MKNSSSTVTLPIPTHLAAATPPSESLRGTRAVRQPPGRRRSLRRQALDGPAPTAPRVRHQDLARSKLATIEVSTLTRSLRLDGFTSLQPRPGRRTSCARPRPGRGRSLRPTSVRPPSRALRQH